MGGRGPNTMSDDDHHFESKADAGASKTFPQQAGTIRKNAYLVIKTRPCKVDFAMPLSPPPFYRYDNGFSPPGFQFLRTGFLLG